MTVKNLIAMEDLLEYEKILLEEEQLGLTVNFELEVLRELLAFRKAEEAQLKWEM